MGSAIFVSYKYGDSSVQCKSKTARTYVNKIRTILEKAGHDYRGETDGTDFSELTEEEINEKLTDRMFATSVTIVLISPNMKDYGRQQRKQWIPREVAYSIKKNPRASGTGNHNAMLAVVLPDTNGLHNYYIQDSTCRICTTPVLRRKKMFPILRKNMLNITNPNRKDCERCGYPSGEHSYISSVKWHDFCADPNRYIEKAKEIRRNIAAYRIYTKLDG